jgi:hypothetical protein
MAIADDTTLLDLKTFMDLAAEKAGVVFFEKYGDDEDASTLYWLIGKAAELVDRIYFGTGGKIDPDSFVGTSVGILTVG